MNVNRETSESRDKETIIKSIYAKLCEKDGRTCDSDTERLSIDSDSEDDGIDEFDGFVGDIDIATVTRVEVV